MRKLALIATFLALPLIAQTSKPPAPQAPATAPAPSLSNSQQIALRSLEEKKQAIQQQWQQLQQEEAAVSSEFAQEHPGWHLTPQLTVAKDEPKPKGGK